MKRRSVLWYWREYYAINRRAWPLPSRRVAALDAFRLARRVR